MPYIKLQEAKDVRQKCIISHRQDTANDQADRQATTNDQATTNVARRSLS